MSKLPFIKREIEVPTKKCVYCEEVKPTSEFPKHKAHKDRLDTRCKKCIKETNKLVYHLRKSTRPKPEVCECCKKKKDNLVLDHSRKTGLFRGWICEPCNHGLGKFGDSTSGVRKAYLYLLEADKNERRHLQSNTSISTSHQRLPIRNRE